VIQPKNVQEVVFFLYKSPNGVESKERTVILLKNTPELKEAYLISQQLRNIYNNNTDKAGIQTSTLVIMKNHELKYL
jgi:hypothetical protein